MEPLQDVATELVAEQAPGALHVIAEERGSDGKEPDGAAVELETPDVADAMSEQPRLHSILFFQGMLKPTLRITGELPDSQMLGSSTCSEEKRG